MKQFVMGAKLTMQDLFSKGMSAAGQATKAFKTTVGGVNSALQKYAQQSQRAAQATKQYKEEGDDAAVKTRAWISSNGRLGASFSLVEKGLASAAAAFGLWKAKEWLIDSNADMETYRNTLNVVMKDEKKAGETLKWATQFAALTPFEIPQVVEATTRLTTYGFEAQKVLGIVGDMASVMGKDLMQAVEAVADAQTGEVERLKEFGITKQMLVDKSKKMGVQIVDKQGSITDMKAFNAVLFKLMEERFKGGMELQSKTFKGMVSNAKDFIGTIGRTLGAPIFDRFKAGLGAIMDKAKAIQASGVFDQIANTIGSTMDRAGRYLNNIKWLFGIVFDRVAKEHAPQIKQLEEAFKSAISWLDTNGRAAFNWLTEQGIPKTVKLLGDMAGKVLDIANFFQNNWQQFLPIIATVTTYILAAKAATIALAIAQQAGLIVQALTSAWGYATTALALMREGYSLAAIAQMELNLAMTANPIGVVIMALAALVGVIVLVVQHWDDICNAVKAAWNWFKSLIDGMPDVVLALTGPLAPILLLIKHFDKVKEVAGKAFGAIKSFFGFGSEDKTPVEQAEAEKPGHNATGTNYWRGGPTWVGERGPELINAPKGTRIASNYESRNMVNPAGAGVSSSAGGSLSINSLVEKLVIEGGDKNPKEIAAAVIEELHELMRQAKEVSGNADMGVLLRA